MAAKRAPYLYQLQPLIKEGKLRLTSDGLVIEVRGPVQVTVHWQQKVRGKLKGFQTEWMANPGQVLAIIWRDVANWERGQFEQQGEQWQDLGVTEIGGKLRVAIVERFDDLPAVLRQQLRHVLANLIGRKLRVRGRVAEIAGDVQRSARLVQRLSQLTQRLVTKIKISPALEARVREEIATLQALLAGARSELKVQAGVKLKESGVLPAKEIAVSLAETQVPLLRARVETLEMATLILERAERVWLRITRNIEGGMGLGYKSLASWIEQLEPYVLEGRAPEPKTLLSIAKAAENLLVYLQRICPFNPYYSWVHTREVERLAKALAYAEAGKAKTLSNALKGALARIEKGVIGEIPKPEELVRIRRRI